MTDDMIEALSTKGGVIQINYLDQFIDNDLYQYSQKSQSLMRELQQKYPCRENADKRREEVTRQFGPAPKAQLPKITEALMRKGYSVLT
jgi:microsomal dipeptidase-like Zn-dependent dipeptidase